jgi:hypothetical protein
MRFVTMMPSLNIWIPHVHPCTVIGEVWPRIDSRGAESCQDEMTGQLVGSEGTAAGECLGRVL